MNTATTNNSNIDPLFESFESVISILYTFH